MIAADLDWLVDAITTPRPPRPSRLRDTTISAERGLHIYRHAYRARLHECLADDFPALRALLGGTGFDTLADAVITQRPPHAATLNRYGRQLVRHLHRTPAATPHPRLALDLARLEWALVEAIHAPLAPPLAPAALNQLATADWAGLRLIPVPSLRVIRARFPIDLLYRQHLRGEAVEAPQPAAETVLVLRRNDGLHRLALAPGRGRLIADLAAGRPLGEALARARLEPAAVRDALAAAVAAGCYRAARSGP